MSSRELIEGPEGVDRVAEAMRESIPADAVIALTGDLAAGKTTLAGAVARTMGYAEGASSPTFSLQHRYGERLRHYDLYRVDFDTVASLGLLEELEAPGWHLVEWMDDRLKGYLVAAGYNLWEVTILPRGDRRHYRIGPVHA